MNAQIVVCPDLNDGAVLEHSLHDLILLYPYVQSISVVPVGLTKYREGLYPLRPVTQEDACKILDICDAHAADALKHHGSRVVFAADELYIKAQRTLPPYDAYEDFTQLENGVGMLTSLITEFNEALAAETEPCSPLPFSIATGTAAAPVLQGLTEKFCAKHPCDYHVYAIRNDFFGEQITVAGLVTGQDLIAQLRGKPLGERLLISQTMLRYDHAVFLDDLTPADVERELHVKLVPVASDGGALLDAMRGC